MLILPNNFSSTLIDQTVIDNKLVEDFASKKKIEIVNPLSLFISFLLSLISKYNNSFWKIYQFFYTIGCLVNAQIAN